MGKMGRFKLFLLGKHGGIATTFAIGLVPLMMIAGLAIDYGIMYREANFLQSRADAAAIAGGHEISLANATGDQIIAAAIATAYQSGKTHRGTPFSVDVAVDLANRKVKVSIKEYWKPFLAQFFYKKVTPIIVDAEVSTIGGTKICVIGLDQKKGATVHLRSNARLLAKGCGVFSNSDSTSSIRMDDNATMEASVICSSGGLSGKSSAFKPDPVVDCPIYSDPLADRPAPSFGGCDYNAMVIKNISKTLSPGVYCKGLTISGTSSVTFKPGIYIIKDGKFRVTDNARATGVNVGFYLTGKQTVLELKKSTSISLTAPTSGIMAGLLFFEDRMAGGNTHRITSDDARLLLGTIYFPNSSLLVDADSAVADQSAYTAIIVKKLRLEEGPVLTLNSNYGVTNVPVPAGLSDAISYGSRIVLVQ